jgi:hypothetical protein
LLDSCQIEFYTGYTCFRHFILRLVFLVWVMYTITNLFHRFRINSVSRRTKMSTPEFFPSPLVIDFHYHCSRYFSQSLEPKMFAPECFPVPLVIGTHLSTIFKTLGPYCLIASEFYPSLRDINFHSSINFKTSRPSFITSELF